MPAYTSDKGEREISIFNLDFLKYAVVKPYGKKLDWDTL